MEPVIEALLIYRADRYQTCRPLDRPVSAALPTPSFCLLIEHFQHCRVVYIQRPSSFKQVNLFKLGEQFKFLKNSSESTRNLFNDKPFPPATSSNRTTYRVIVHWLIQPNYFPNFQLVEAFTSRNGRQFDS